MAFFSSFTIHYLIFSSHPSPCTYIEEYRTEHAFRLYKKACVGLFAGQEGRREVGMELNKLLTRPKKGKESQLRVQGTNLEYYLKDFSAVKVGFQFEV